MASSLETLIFEIIANDKGASAAFDKFRGKVDQTSSAVDKNSGSMEKSAESMLRQKDAADKAGTGADSLFKKVTTLAGSTGSVGGGGIGALVAAGVALSPVLLTLGTGFVGLGAAAYGIYKPISTASQATGGLSKNLGTLDPMTRQIAKGLIGLGGTFEGFQKALKPEIFGIFNQGLQLAGHLLTDIEPVTAATGKAFAGFLGALDKMFQGGEWQQFFRFMAATAAPDMQALGGLLIALAKDIPPIAESLQPFAIELLHVATSASSAVGFLAKMHLTLPLLLAAIGAMTPLGPLGAEIGLLAGGFLLVASSGAKLQPVLDRVQSTMGDTGKSAVQVTAAVTRFGTSAGSVVAPVSNLSLAQQELVKQEVAAQKAIQASHPFYTSYGKDLAGASGASRDLSNNAAAAGQAAFQLKLQTMGASGPVRDLSNHVSGVATAALKMKIEQEGASGASRDLSNNAVAAAKVTDTFAGKVKNLSDAAQLAAPNLQQVYEQVTNLHNAEQKSLGTLTAYNDAIIAQYNSAQSLNQALKKSHDAIGLDTAAQRNSFSAADQYINNTLAAAKAAGNNTGEIDKVITSLKNELPRLESVKGGTQQYWQEVRTLVGWLHTLERERTIHEQITVSGHGQWAISGPSGSRGLQNQFPGPRAAGGAYITAGTTPTADNVIARVSKGELIVPTHMVSSGAVDHLRGRIPGFSAGGVVGSYSGSVPGIPGFINRENKATVNAIASSVAAAVHSALQAAASSPGTFGAMPGGGQPAANAALARRMYPPWATGMEWNAWNAVAMAESGWNQFARNPSSGAYGIPQALPPSKMGAAANPPQSNPGAQIAWMISYIKSVYGDPIGAAAHENAFHWYGDGFHGTVSKPTLMGVGERGPERVDISPAGQGQTITLVVKTGHGASALDRAVVDIIKHSVRVEGGGDVQVALGS